jgi:hypothetical protein
LFFFASPGEFKIASNIAGNRDTESELFLQNTKSMNGNSSTARLEETPLSPVGQTPEAGHKRSINIVLQEDSGRNQACSGEESLRRCTRKQRAEEIRSIVSCNSCCGYQNISNIHQPGRSAVTQFEPAAWKETPAEYIEWIAMFDFLSE